MPSCTGLSTWLILSDTVDRNAVFTEEKVVNDIGTHDKPGFESQRE